MELIIHDPTWIYLGLYALVGIIAMGLLWVSVWGGPFNANEIKENAKRAKREDLERIRKEA